jgi:hypothetical protein
MSQSPDTWYVRLPDGRVLRAASTHVVRQHLGSGRIPLESRVRRSAEEEWLGLDWTEEFSDLVRKQADTVAPAPQREGGATPVARQEPNLAARLEATRPGTVGLRALADELIAALDSTLARSKLLVAGTAGVLSATVLAIAGNMFSVRGALDKPWLYGAWAVIGLLILIIWVIGNVLLTQMTYVELSQLRPARWKEARAGVIGFTFRLLFAYVVAAGLPIVAILTLRWLPQAVPDMNLPERFLPYREMIAEMVGIFAMLVEIVLWPVLGVTLLLGPVVVIEECSMLAALGQWWWLLRQYLGRLFLYESTAVLGGIATLAFAFPLALAAWGRLHHWGNLETPTGFGLCLLAGLAAAPLIAYLAVAHVFIYLSLRYGFDHRRG